MRQPGAMTRAEAARAVSAVVDDGRSLDRALEDGASRLPAGEHALLRAMAYGALRYHWRLDSQLDALLDRPIRRRDQVVRALLRVGLYQVSDMRVPGHASVSQTVEATRALGRPKLAGLVNAVLRRFLRETPTPDLADESVRFDHPPWMIERIREDWPDAWQDILAANNDRAPMWLRVNAKRLTPEAYLRRNAVEGDLETGLDQAVRLARPCPVGDLPGFGEGEVSVQDGAAQLAAPWLLADGGSRLLDMCAAPGGKTAHMLELAAPGATLTALDSDPERTDVVRDTLARLGLDATVGVADASNTGSWWDGEPFDRVLLDAPCSASGVIRRHPDIKHLRRPADIDAMAERQAALLAAGWEVLAPGGRLLYVTCSLFRGENDAVISALLAARTDLSVNQLLPNNNIHDLMVPTTHGFQVLPGAQGLDGFYFACLEKRA